MAASGGHLLHQEDGVVDHPGAHHPLDEAVEGKGSVEGLPLPTARGSVLSEIPVTPFQVPLSLNSTVFSRDRPFEGFRFCFAVTWKVIFAPMWAGVNRQMRPYPLRGEGHDLPAEEETKQAAAARRRSPPSCPARFSLRRSLPDFDDTFTAPVSSLTGGTGAGSLKGKVMLSPLCEPLAPE